MKNYINQFTNYHPVCNTIYYYFEKYFMLWMLLLTFFVSYYLFVPVVLFVSYMVYDRYRHKNLVLIEVGSEQVVVNNKTDN